MMRIVTKIPLIKLPLMVAAVLTIVWQVTNWPLVRQLMRGGTATAAWLMGLTTLWLFGAVGYLFVRPATSPSTRDDAR